MWTDDEIDTSEDPNEEQCPFCDSMATYETYSGMCQCFQEINDPNEQGVSVLRVEYTCAECDSSFVKMYGRPLNVECDCD